MGGARVTTLVTLRKCTLGNKREIKTLKFVSASTKGFRGGLAWIKPSKKDMAVTFSYLQHTCAASFLSTSCRVLRVTAPSYSLCKWACNAWSHTCGTPPPWRGLLHTCSLLVYIHRVVLVTSFFGVARHITYLFFGGR